MQIRRAVYRSELGHQRKSNHDGLLSLNRVPLFAVADGNGGAEAAQLSLKVLKEQATRLGEKNAQIADNPNTRTRLALGRFFEHAFERIGRVLQDENHNRRHRLTSTLVAATMTGPYAFVAHVGDSRAYLMRGGKLRCLTYDHTLAALQLRRGDISQADYQTSPFRSTLSQALGMSNALEVDVAEVRLMPYDVLLLCSNGLHRFVGHEALRQSIDPQDLEASADRLIAHAIAKGAPDNVTLVLIATEPDVPLHVMAETLDSAVRQVFLFASLPDPEWARITPYLEQLSFDAKAPITKPGQPADAMYFVAHGAATLEQGLERQRLGPGDHFGALNLTVAGTTQLDRVTAEEATICYVLHRERFEQLVRQHPALGTRLTLALLETLGDRLGALTSRLAHIIDAAHGK